MKLPLLSMLQDDEVREAIDLMLVHGLQQVSFPFQGKVYTIVIYEETVTINPLAEGV